MTILKTRYHQKVRQQLKQKYNYKSVMQIPKIVKIVVMQTIGKNATGTSNEINEVLANLAAITGQKPALVKAKKSLAGFKLRKGMSLGGKVTLRNQRMWDFLYKLITIVIPRIRDFRGINHNSFDGQGNFSLGIKEQIVFFEIDFDKVKKIRGLDIAIVTSTNQDKQARELLKLLGMPFAKKV